MQYALLVYAGADDTGRDVRPIPEDITALLDRPEVTGWFRLHAAGSATTVGSGADASLLVDGPFVESKEYLAGVIVIDTADLDAALALGKRFRQTMATGAIEIRPMIEGRLRER